MKGVGTFLVVAPQDYNFGGVAVGTASSPVRVTLTDAGKTSLNLTPIALGGFKPGDYSQTNQCPATLAAGSACPVRITFTPTAKGSRSATLVVIDSDPGSPQEAFLSGMGL